MARARNVIAALAAAGVQITQSYADGKSELQPVADNKLADGRAKNRRVKIETLSFPTPESGAYSRENCSPAWRARLLSMTEREALAFARTQVREGWVDPETLMETVIVNGRLDLFQAFWRPRTGLALDQKQRRIVFLQVLGRGDLPMVEAALDLGWPLLLSQREPLAHVLCNSSDRTAPLIRLLIARGARPSPAPSGQLPLLNCALSKGLEVVQLLLEAGANPREVQGVVALAASNREMLDLLLAAGADPRDKLPTSYGGGTLFHVMTLREPADIHWLQSLGLDINEKNASGRTPLAVKLDRAHVKLLDAMVAAGATLDEPDHGLLNAAQNNTAVLLWLLERGASLTRNPALLAQWVRRGDSALPVMEAYRARGGDMNARNHKGHTALAEAIYWLQPTAVAFLLGAGADRLQVAPGISAEAMAMALDVRPLQPCSSRGCEPAAPPGSVDV